MTKNIKKTEKFWLLSAKDNFGTAKDLFNANRYNFSIFMCQQAVEALLKAVYIIKKKDRPEFIHKLPKLLDLINIDVPDSIDKKILKLDAHYIKARYKEDRFNSKIYNKENTQSILKDTEEIFQWFMKNLKLKI